jgi:hypothetical protein
MIELLDARSDAWGASAYDLLANSGGAALFMGQELLWNQQKVKMKFSFHSSPFPKYRPDLLGSNFSQQLMKDYNGQTYWLSANVHSLLHSTHWPKWLNIALGYSATGLLGGESNPINYQTPTYSRERQLLLSFDLDLSELPVKSKWLKKVFKLINIVKFPAPTVELRSGKLYGHYLYL